jgi:hypothetical protein
MSERIEGAQQTPAEVVRGLYEALGRGDVVGTLTGTLRAHGSGEQFPLTMVEIHHVEDGTVHRIDVYTKNPDELAAFYARAAAGSP